MKIIEKFICFSISVKTRVYKQITERIAHIAYGRTTNALVVMTITYAMWAILSVICY